MKKKVIFRETCPVCNRIFHRFACPAVGRHRSFRFEGRTWQPPFALITVNGKIERSKESRFRGVLE